MEAVRSKTVNRSADVKPAAARPVVKPAVPSAVRPLLQASPVRVSSPHEPAEKEAEATARQILRMPVPESTPDPPKFTSPWLRRFSDSGIPRKETKKDEEQIRRRADGPPTAGEQVVTEINASRAEGNPLPPQVRSFMEPRFRAGFGNVRVHTGERAARLNSQLNARAFTYGDQIFFGRDRFRPETDEGRELIAHELTHTIQQGHAVQRAVAPVASFSPVMIQCLGIGDALDYIAGQANNIPGFRLLTIILGVNPITLGGVDRSSANVLRALIEVMPGGALITQALDNHGIIDRVATWVDQQVRTLGLTGAALRQALMTFLRSLSLGDLAPWNWGDVWNRAKAIFTGPIDQLKSFARGLVTGILRFIREAILLPLARLAEGTRGYDLLKALLGKDPVTGQPVPRNAETLIAGFLRLIGQDEVWENMRRARAIPRAWAWFQGAVAGLVGFVRQIPALFLAAFRSLELLDLVLLPRAFAKVARVFGTFLGSFISWAGNAVWNLLEIIFDVVSPGAFAYVRRTGAALRSILRNPIPFVLNLVRAAKLGFQNFAARFLTHLKAGLIDWLTGALPGVYIPKAFTLQEIARFVFSVLGLTWQNIRQKLVRVVGEPAMKAMETGFDIVVTLVREGPAAAWDKIKEQLANLKDMVIGGITDFVVETVVKKAIPKLISLFIPGAGFISAILSIYDTIMVFVSKLSRIIQVVTGFINSIVAIAAGAIGAAASRVESILANLLSLAINFLAGFVGLGKVADKIMGVINKVRGVIDRALDSLIGWIVNAAKKLFAKLFGKDKKAVLDPEVQKKLDAGLAAIDAAEAPLMKDGKLAEEDAQKVASSVKAMHPVFKSLSVVQSGDHWEYDYVVNPPGNKAGAKTGVKSYLGATRIDKSKSTFKGSFGDPAWNWGGYPTKATPHPANEFAGSPNAASVPKPAGSYSVSGAGTEGNLSTDKWRTHINNQKNTEKGKLQKKYPKWKATDLENTAKSMIEKKYNKMGWKDLYLLDWDQHHIHPVNWKGPNRTSNMQYLRRYSEHSPLTSWWNSRKAKILANL